MEKEVALLDARLKSVFLKLFISLFKPHFQMDFS